MIVGALGALAFATENAHQSWSAIFLGDVLDASPALAATGPALFAAVVATARFTTSALGVAHPIAVVTAGALTAAAGTLVLAGAGTLTVGLLGLAVAAAGTGTGVLYPTLVSALSTHLPDAARGSAVSIIATIAYVGFLAGPVYVGGWAAAGGLPTAMLAVAALAALLQPQPPSRCGQPSTCTATTDPQLPADLVIRASCQVRRSSTGTVPTLGARARAVARLSDSKPVILGR